MPRGRPASALDPDTTTSDFACVDLTAFFNNDGISSAPNPADGAFNIRGNTFPAEELPPGGTLCAFHGIPFRFPPTDDGARNNVACVGQDITFPETRIAGFSVLGASDFRSEDDAHVRAPHGQTRRVHLGLSGFWPRSRASFGNRLALSCRRLHYPRHVQANMGPRLWIHSVAFAPVRSGALSLPDNPALHLFALTLKRTTP
ncbi:MAG: hypothetical protein ACREF4_00530 [Gammaproteobacteria bacterium]